MGERSLATGGGRGRGEEGASRGVAGAESGEGARGRGGLAGAGRARSREKYEQDTEVHLRCPCPGWGWGASPAGNCSAAPECWEEAGNPRTSDREAEAPSVTALPLACPARPARLRAWEEPKPLWVTRGRFCIPIPSPPLPAFLYTIFASIQGFDQT